MTKKDAKNAPNNELIVELADCLAIIVSKNGQRCDGKIKNMNIIANELMNRGLLTQEDIDYLNG